MSASRMKQGPQIVGMPTHIRTLVQVGLPLALSQLSEMAMAVTDTVLLGSLGVDAVAIGGISNNFFFTTMISFQAVLGGVGVLLSHARGGVEHGHGGGHDRRSIISAGVVLGMVAFIPCLLLLLCSSGIFSLMGEPEMVTRQGGQFINVLLYALWPNLVLLGLCRVALPSLGAESLLLWTMPAMALCNGVLNAALIHGWFGLPAYGLFGSAHATMLTGWAMSLVLLLLCLGRPQLRHLLKPARVHWPLFRELLVLGLPMMVTAASELLLFQITTLNAGRLGTRSLAAHQVALNTISLLFMVCLAIGQAANVRVAYWRGARKRAEACRASSGALLLVLAWTILTGLVLMLLPGRIARLYYTGGPPDAGTFATTVLLLKIAGIFQIVDGVQAVCNGALRGCGDTFVPMVISIVSYGVVGIGLGYWLAFHQGYGVEGLWIGLAAGLGVTAFALGARLYLLLYRTGDARP
ncbi:MATE family efflux transporter [Bombella apis]|uniref:MATE family efflux transporter n=1 Tax=Bombella apis TaxID=1785988 RepID=UPI0023F41C70|nr:MATE family efflux transporter [Bombella apis]MCT6813621.1 MATE family efflux transporter [Bombella apis]MCT6819877.1 MATE family efflux transporter [Bombella apis]MCT6845574.1 MATE family efflux transporter [Bombella apis]